MSTSPCLHTLVLTTYVVCNYAEYEDLHTVLDLEGKL